MSGLLNLAVVRDALQEARELGFRGTAFRAYWEFRLRTGWLARLSAPPDWRCAVSPGNALAPAAGVPMGDPGRVAAVMRDRIGSDSLARLESAARRAARGRILCFGRREADYGDPIDWPLNPLQRTRWPLCHWSSIPPNRMGAGDIKLTWEIGRFPQAYSMARAAAFVSETGEHLSSAFCRQVRSFVEHNPFGMGVHWSSGQEIAIRAVAWMFAAHVFSVIGRLSDGFLLLVGRALYESGVHIERHLEYARRSVYNNHLLSEALGLYWIGAVLPESAESRRWCERGRTLLSEQAERQVYRDGGYIQQSHNYHRMAMQIYLCAFILARSRNDVPSAWRGAMERSLDFLLAHQNETDGRLPNFGSNDGAEAVLLSTCDFSDFRPTLQALSVAVRGERVFERGPWDEMSAWLLGEGSLDLPLRPPARCSVSFSYTGSHVLRSGSPGSFGVLRCGTLHDRFSQIDMLQLDVWWRGYNVLVDAGSYLYNGSAIWHNHFLRTESHNTVMVDGRDQMLHYRQFKCLYWTKARLLRFEDEGKWVLCEGEHYGYRRHPGKCVHRRSVLYFKDDIWIVVDRVSGVGHHKVRLHWLGGDYPFQAGEGAASLHLSTPGGLFSVSTYDELARPLRGSVVAGGETPPRGWLSRYYAEKTAVPSHAVERYGELPISAVSVLCPGVPQVRARGADWTVIAGDSSVEFVLSDSRTETMSLLAVSAARKR